MENRRYQLVMVIISLFCVFPHLSAQQHSFKFGKVTAEEVSMTTYAPDTTASAVFIFKNGRTTYDWVHDDFKVSYLVEAKIKILKPEGTDWANIEIPYYENKKSALSKEVVGQIDAIAYNMENGKIVKTKMKKEYVFRERINDKYMQVKFSIPAVKVGTVIEYKYVIQSDSYYQLKDWEMQDEIPVISSTYDITVPEYFKFNFEMRRGDYVKVDKKDVPYSFSIQGHMINANAQNIRFTGSDMPAVKGDDYIWYPDDYKAQVNFELDGLDFPGTPYRSFTSTWEKIDQLLLEDEDFGKLLKMKNPFQEEMKSLNIDNLSTNEKIVTLFQLLKQKVAWNEKYALYGMEIKKGIKEGNANNAELNFILMSMLRDVNIKAYPIVMSRRNMGIIPYTHPSINKINTFVVGIENSDSTRVYLDGSVEKGFINILPPVLLTNRARIISSDRFDNRWVNLSGLGTNSARSIIKVTVDSEGNILGERNVSYLGQQAVNCRSDFKAAKDSTEHIEKKETRNGIKILTYEQKGIQAFSPEVKETYTFTKKATISGDYIYINPLVFIHIDTNPFTQEERQLPVELPYPYSARLSTAITIPEGYQLDELPKPQNLTMDENAGNCRYIIQQLNNQVILNYSFTLNKTFFGLNEYALLKQFWGLVSDKNNEMIVLKKVTQ